MMRTQKNFFFEHYLVFHQHFNKFYHWEFYVHVAHLSKVSDVTILSILRRDIRSQLLYSHLSCCLSTNNGICFF